MRLRKVAKGAAVAALGTAIALGGAMLANAAPVGGDSADIPIVFEIEDDGEIILEVGAGTMVLTEVDPSTDPTQRQFTSGTTMPTVTVTDTRTASKIAADGDVFWWVAGSVYDVTKGGTATTDVLPGWFGWVPVEVDFDGSPDVFIGDPICSTEDAAGTCPAGYDLGLVGKELLFFSVDSLLTAAPAPGGVYEATAEVFLHAPTNVPAGVYGAKLAIDLILDDAL